MYPSGFPEVMQLDDFVFHYRQDHEHILMGLALAERANSTNDWLSVLGYAMEEESQERLVAAVDNRGISVMGLMVLAHRLSEKAIGMELQSAGVLAASVLGSWIPFSAWAATRGLRLSTMEVHELLSACYGWLLEGRRDDDKAVAKLNRQVFGRSNPWGV